MDPPHTKKSGGNFRVGEVAPLIVPEDVEWCVSCAPGNAWFHWGNWKQHIPEMPWKSHHSEAKEHLVANLGKQDELMHSITVHVLYISIDTCLLCESFLCVEAIFLLTLILNIGLYSKLSIYNSFACYSNCVVFKLQPWNLITGINGLILNKDALSVFVQRVYTECSRSF